MVAEAYENLHRTPYSCDPLMDYDKIGYVSDFMTELGTETWTTLSVKYNISSAVPYY
jgi:hypothetical protein